MDLAFKTAELSKHPRYLFGALVVKGGNVLSIGVNSLNAPKRFFKPHRDNMHLHAEVAALCGISKDRSKGSTLYLGGLSAAGNEVNTMPCKTCLKAIDTMLIKRVVYSDNGQIKELK